MNFWKLSGLAAIAGLLLIAAPAKHAEAAPVAAAGIASSVQRDVVPNVSEVQYRHHRHGYGHHRGYRHHPRVHRHWHRPHRAYGHRHMRPHHRHWR